MKNDIRAILVDIGGVLLTNGWDHTMRREAARKFGFDYDEMNERHHLTFDTYEEGKLSLAQYLERVVFHQERSFTRAQFEQFMFEQSRPRQKMIDLIRNLKRRYGLKIVAVSNEGRELTLHRVKTFQLSEFIDFFVSSCFVHMRKPDEDMYRMALDGSQVPAAQALYIDDRPMFVDVAAAMGIRGIRHTGDGTTRAALAEFGLTT